MKKLLSMAVLSAVSLLGISQTATASTKIVFPAGSYCGSYSGDFRNSKAFNIYLKKGQLFEVKSASQEDTITVKDSRGTVRGSWANSTTYQVTTRNKGNHTIVLKSPESYQDVQFCAY